MQLKDNLQTSELKPDFILQINKILICNEFCRISSNIVASSTQNFTVRVGFFCHLKKLYH